MAKNQFLSTGYLSVLNPYWKKGSYYLERKINSAFVTSGGNSTPVETSRSWTGEDSTPDPIPDVYLYICIRFLNIKVKEWWGTSYM